MLRDDAVAIIKRGLGFLSGMTHDAAIVDALKQAQAAREGARSVPWFLLQEDQTLALTVGVRSAPLPDGFIREDIDFNPVTSTDSAGGVAVLEPLGYDEAVGLYDLEATGQPEIYSVRASTVEVFPLPDAAYTMEWSFYKKDVDLSANVENLWLQHAPYVLIADAGLKMATDLRDAEGAAIYKAEKNQWDDWFQRRMTERLEFNNRYIVGKYA